MAHKKKLLLQYSSQSSRNFIQLIHRYLDYEYTIYEISLEKYAQSFFNNEWDVLSSKFINLAVNDNDSLIIIKKILLFRGINQKIASCIHFFEYLFFFTFKIINAKIQILKHQKNINIIIKKNNIAAILLLKPPCNVSAVRIMPQTKIVPTIIIPGRPVKNADAIFGSAYNKSFQKSGSMTHSLAKILFPNWMHAVNGETRFTQPPLEHFADFACGIGRNETLSTLRERFPWCCIYSEKEKEDLTTYGGIPATWEITGELSSDRLFEISRYNAEKLAELTETFGFLHNRTVMFDYHEYTRLGGGEGYAEELFAFAQQAQQWKWNVLFCPHPNIPPHLRDAPLTYGLPVAHEATINVLPCADMYISSGGSTVRWAKQLGLPVIMYNVFRNDAGENMGPGTLYFRENERTIFFAAAKKLLTDNDTLTELKKAAQADATNWGLLDGRCADRIRAYIAKAIASHSQGTTIAK